MKTRIELEADLAAAQDALAAYEALRAERIAERWRELSVIGSVTIVWTFDETLNGLRFDLTSSKGEATSFLLEQLQPWDLKILSPKRLERVLVDAMLARTPSQPLPARTRDE